MSDPTQSFLIKKLITGARNLIPQGTVRQPIMSDNLSLLVKSANFVSSSMYQASMLKAMYLLAFHAFLRVGEFTVSANKTSDQVIQYSDITLTSDKVLVTVRFFKHKGTRHPVTLSIGRKGDNLCVVTALFQYIQHRGIRNGPLFMFPDGFPVSTNFFNRQLLLSLKWAGLDPKIFKGHSFRIGAATSAALAGASDLQLQAMGRWNSNAYKKYVQVRSIAL